MSKKTKYQVSIERIPTQEWRKLYYGDWSPEDRKRFGVDDIDPEILESFREDTRRRGSEGPHVGRDDDATWPD